MMVFQLIYNYSSIFVLVNVINDTKIFIVIASRKRQISTVNFFPRILIYVLRL